MRGGPRRIEGGSSSGEFDRITPPDRSARPGRPPARNDDPAGRAALFSAADAGQGGRQGRRLRVVCGRCGAVAPLDAPTVLRCALPLFLVAPWRREPIFATCPTGRHRAWLRVGLGGQA